MNEADLPQFDPGRDRLTLDFWPCPCCWQWPCAVSAARAVDAEAHQPLCVLCTAVCDSGVCVPCLARLDAEEV